MTILTIAIASLRFRREAFVATFVNVFVGALVLMAFASLLDTAGQSGVSATDASTLRTIAGAVGGWGLVIVGFGVASTTSLAIRQRQAEMALLKAIGATPGQLGRLITGEGVGVAVVAAALAIAPAFLTGRAVLEALRHADQVTPAVPYRFGPIALVAGLSATLLATVGATAIAARSAGRVSAKEALSQAAVDAGPIGKGRVITGLGLLVAGVGCAFTTATVLKDEGFTTLSVAGQACIACAMGLALLSPLALRALAHLVAPMTRGSGTAYLAVSALRERTRQAATVTMPVVVLTGLAVGTFCIQQIYDDTNAAAGIAVSVEDKGVQTLNLIIIGMISLFAAVVLVNNCVASLLARSQEFGLARKIGATPGQVLRAVAWETTFAAATGLALGTVAAAIGITGFVYGRTGSLRPGVDSGPYLAIVAFVLALTWIASLTAARRSLAIPMVDATGPARE
ncbi:FtsX-like permease family protein [Kribbella sp. NPDC023855]|uniref:FtsX-like permease family protein n=1 Tax=Kribbella sp. NPDC023855 TaxID=3154698 RepID=UPI0033C0239B